MTIIGGTTNGYQLFQILAERLGVVGAAAVAAMVITGCRLSVGVKDSPPP
jgi:hypothetical protein